MKMKVALLALVATASTVAFGQETKRNYRYAYGMAGCGLGSMAFEKNEKGWQIFASLVNGIYGNNTSAMSSGTSNCTDKSPESASTERKVFVAKNLNSLSKQAAQGSGEHLEALADVFGCADALPEFNQLSQSKYDVIFAGNNADKVVERYLVEIKASKQLSRTCTRAG